MRIETLPDSPALARHVAEWMTSQAEVATGIFRVSLSGSSRHVAFLVAGKEKAAIFKAIRAGVSDVPAARVRPVGELIWFADRAAAGEG
jgi:hypothetical protein